MGREKTREGGERRGRTLGQEGCPGLNGRELGTKIYGAKLGARVPSDELPTMPSTEPRPGASAPTLMAAS